MCARQCQLIAETIRRIARHTRRLTRMLSKRPYASNVTAIQLSTRLCTSAQRASSARHTAQFTSSKKFVCAMYSLRADLLRQEPTRYPKMVRHVEFVGALTFHSHVPMQWSFLRSMRISMRASSSHARQHNLTALELHKARTRGIPAIASRRAWSNFIKCSVYPRSLFATIPTNMSTRKVSV